MLDNRFRNSSEISRGGAREFPPNRFIPGPDSEKVHSIFEFIKNIFSKSTCGLSQTTQVNTIMFKIIRRHFVRLMTDT